MAYLCARLLDLREETKAARCIQTAWRRHRLKKQLERKKVRKIGTLWFKITSRFLYAKSTFDLIKLNTRDINLHWIIHNTDHCPVTLNIIILWSIAISLNFNHPCSLFVIILSLVSPPLYPSYFGIFLDWKAFFVDVKITQYDFHVSFTVHYGLTLSLQFCRPHTY